MKKSKLYLLSHLILGTAFTTSAAEFTVVDAQNTPLQNVVVVVDDGTDTVPTSGIQTAQMSQRDRHFDPFILAVQQNAAVTFPNNDDIAHHVYSFSEAKRFEKKIYKGASEDPVIFEKAGVVELGCNVHDWMLAYIFVADSEYFSMTDESGKAQIALPDGGEYQVKIWHPLLQENELETRTLTLVQGNNTIQLDRIFEEGDDFDIDELGAY